jgi:hypothetical protein
MKKEFRIIFNPVTIDVDRFTGFLSEMEENGFLTERNVGVYDDESKGEVNLINSICDKYSYPRIQNS